MIFFKDDVDKPLEKQKTKNIQSLSGKKDKQRQQRGFEKL